jgi:hypothetical protein
MRAYFMLKINSYNFRGWGMMTITGMCILFMMQIFSCHGKQTNVENVKPMFVEEHKDKLANFVFLVKETHALCVTDEETSCLEEASVMPTASASGVVLSSSSSHIFILTANHFCETSNIEKMMGEIKIRAFIGETSRLVDTVTFSKKADLCLLQGLRFKEENFKTTRIAKEMPSIGEQVINVAAPDGMASPNTRLMFDGNFAGCEGLSCVYSIPATFGSSGSAIYNKEGELISLLVAAAINFENVSMGPHVSNIKILIDTVEEEIDIY